MTGIAALAAAAAATSKIASPVTSTTPSVAAVTMASTSLTSAAGQTIKVVQAGGNLMSTGTKSSKSSFLVKDLLATDLNFEELELFILCFFFTTALDFAFVLSFNRPFAEDSFFLS